MAKKEKDLFDTLRASGLRKKVASALSSTASSAKGKSKSKGKGKGKTPKVISESVDNLRKAAASLEKHVVDPKRSAAAKKGAQTRKRNAAKRSASAKKAAKTRARSS
jgi:hypothetical protein